MRGSKLLSDESGATTIEYTLVLAFMSAICIFATIWLISVLLHSVAVLVVNMALYITAAAGP